MSNRLPLEFRLRRKRARDLGHATYMGRPCKNGHDGLRTLSGNCVECQKDQLAKHRGARNARAQEWRRDNRARAMLNEARSRAKAKGLEFNLDLDDIKIPDMCPALGIPMDRPSLDRRDNALGYVKGNVFVISWRANALKRDMTLAEIEGIARYMRDSAK